MSQIIRDLFENYRKGFHYKKNNDYEKSIIYFSEALNKFLENPQLLKEQNLSFVGDIFIGLSQIYYLYRDYEKSIDICLNGLKYFHKSSELLLIICYSFFKLNKIEETLFYLDKIKVLKLTNSETEKMLRLFVSCYSLQGNYASAKDYFSELLSNRYSVTFEYCKKLIETKSEPSISICIITFNSEKHIQKCLESIIPFADEIIIMDTGSTDNTKNICRGIAGDGRLELVMNPTPSPCPLPWFQGRGKISNSLPSNEGRVGDGFIHSTSPATPEIKIFETIWNDNFSEARN